MAIKWLAQTIRLAPLLERTALHWVAGGVAQLFDDPLALMAQIINDRTTLAIAEALGVPTVVEAPSTFTLHHDVRLTRPRFSMRLIHDSGVANDIAPNAALLRLLIQARIWWAELRKPSS